MLINLNVKVKINERISLLTKKLYKNKHKDCLLSPDVTNALVDIHNNDLVVTLIDKATGNITLACKNFYASVIARELGLKKKLSAYTHNSTKGLSSNTIIKVKKNLSADYSQQH